MSKSAKGNEQNTLTAVTACIFFTLPEKPVIQMAVSGFTIFGTEGWRSSGGSWRITLG